MQLREIRSGSVLLELDPGLCLAIAEACWHAGEWASEKENEDHAAVFALLKVAFDSFALIGAAQGYCRAHDLADWTLDEVRNAWTVFAARKGSER